MKRKTVLLIFLSCAVLAGAACTPTVANRGNLLKDDQIQKVQLGFHTRSDVLRHLGSPTTTAPFDDTKWYYIGQETSKKGILDPEVVDERVVLVKFDEQGTVQKIAELDAERIDLPIDRSKTPTHGQKITVMQQLLGNVGRFNPASEINR